MSKARSKEERIIRWAGTRAKGKACYIIWWTVYWGSFMSVYLHFQQAGYNFTDMKLQMHNIVISLVGGSLTGFWMWSLNEKMYGDP